MLVLVYEFQKAVDVFLVRSENLQPFLLGKHGFFERIKLGFILRRKRVKLRLRNLIKRIILIELFQQPIQLVHPLPFCGRVLLDDSRLIRLMGKRQP